MEHRAYDAGVGDLDTYFKYFETAVPIVSENEKYVVIHETMDENNKNLCLNSVLFRPDNGTFMFVDTGNDIYLEYNSFQLVKKFMSHEEIDRFERVREEAVLISRFVMNEYENSIREDDRGR